MEYRRLGKAGLQVSALSFGSWVTFKNQIDVADAIRLLSIAFDAGVNFFDNAEVYAGGESEIIMGKAFKELGLPRDQIILSSKVFWGGDHPTQRGLHRKHVWEGCHAALKRLQVDYLDLYFCHRPDLHTPVEETVFAMNHLIAQGKIMYWGTSEWSATQLTEAFEVAANNNLIGPTMEQPQYNMFHRERVEQEYAGVYAKYGLGTTIWSPLASGLLTGKYKDGIPEESRANLQGFEWLRNRFSSPQGKEQIAKTEQLRPIAADLGMSLPQLAICWCLANHAVSTVILGASKEHQLTETLAAMELAPKLTAEVQQRIESILQNKPQPPQDFLK